MCTNFLEAENDICRAYKVAVQFTVKRTVYNILYIQYTIQLSNAFAHRRYIVDLRCCFRVCLISFSSSRALSKIVTQP